MKLSVITIAYNNEKDIEKTIESVLAQEGMELEYLIIDGASTDKTVEKANKYSEIFAKKGVSYHVFSEPDQGIYNAMNKGIRLATGDVIGILNSGDWYEPEIFPCVEKSFGESGCELMYGHIRIHKQNGDTFVKKARFSKGYQTSRNWNHPTMFVKSQLYKEYPFRELGIHDDYGFYLQMVKQKRKIVVVNKVLANFQMGGASNGKDFNSCKKRIRDRYEYCYRINGYSRWYLLECWLIEAAKFLLG